MKVAGERMEIQTVLSLGFIQCENWEAQGQILKCWEKKVLYIFVLILDRISSLWKCYLQRMLPSKNVIFKECYLPQYVYSSSPAVLLNKYYYYFYDYYYYLHIFRTYRLFIVTAFHEDWHIIIRCYQN